MLINDKELALIIRVLLKALIIVLIINCAWALLPNKLIGNLSIYNSFIEGRDRLPFGENPDRSYNLSLYNLDAMFASHKVSIKSKENNFRVLLIGDSSIWGFLQKPAETLTGVLNDAFEHRDIDVYNLGYPSISVLKDAQIIDQAMKYEPDLVIWFTTLEAFPVEKQLSTPINRNNAENINTIIKNYNLKTITPIPISYFDKIFWAQRRNIYDVFRLQLYGFLWDATRIDQDYPETYNPAQRDFTEIKQDYYGIKEGEDLEADLALEILGKTIQRYKDTKIIVINEPILISQGINADYQYNFYYPRWAYDKYREIINNYTRKNGIPYHDFWNLVPETEFTNSAIHLTLEGEKIFANEIHRIINDNIGE